MDELDEALARAEQELASLRAEARHRNGEAEGERERLARKLKHLQAQILAAEQALAERDAALEPLRNKVAEARETLAKVQAPTSPRR